MDLPIIVSLAVSLMGNVTLIIVAIIKARAKKEKTKDGDKSAQPQEQQSQNTINVNILTNDSVKQDKDKSSGTLDASCSLVRVGNIDAIIVTEESEERNMLFKRMENSTTKTYRTYGIGLTTLSQREDFFDKLIAKNNDMDINICITNPNIFKDKACKDNIKNNYCTVLRIFQENHNQNSCQDISTLKHHLNTNCEFPKDLLMKYDVLFNQKLLQKYVGRTIDYHANVTTSFANFKDIVSKLNGNGKRIYLHKINSFLPLSMTVVDEDENHGEMIVEYLLPYTKKRIMLHIKRETAREPFDSFCNLLDEIFDSSEKYVIKDNKWDWEPVQPKTAIPTSLKN
jgi:hypothetical protein